MHYGRNSFSIDGSDTLVPLQKGAVIGQRDALTNSDILGIQIVYGCPKSTDATTTTTTDTTTTDLTASTSTDSPTKPPTSSKKIFKCYVEY